MLGSKETMLGSKWNRRVTSNIHLDHKHFQNLTPPMLLIFHVYYISECPPLLLGSQLNPLPLSRIKKHLIMIMFTHSIFSHSPILTSMEKSLDYALMDLSSPPQVMFNIQLSLYWFRKFPSFLLEKIWWREGIEINPNLYLKNWKGSRARVLVKKYQQLVLL